MKLLLKSLRFDNSKAKKAMIIIKSNEENYSVQATKFFQMSECFWWYFHNLIFFQTSKITKPLALCMFDKKKGNQ